MTEAGNQMKLAVGILESAGLPIPYGVERERLTELWSIKCGFASAEVLTYVAIEWATTKCKFPCLAEFLDEVKQVDFASKPHLIGYTPKMPGGTGEMEEVWEVLDLTTGKLISHQPSLEQIGTRSMEPPRRLMESSN